MRNRPFFWALGCAALIASSVASCRDFTAPAQPRDAGGAGAAVGGDGEQPPTASSGSGGEGPVAAGDGGAGGRGEDADGEAAGAAGAAGAGDVTGAGGDRSTAALLPGNDYGIVRLFIGGQAVCGGTLINNSWLLTADACVPSGTPDVTVAFGVDSAHPDQAERAVELVRFPGNDGTDATRGRNLALLGVAHPFQINAVSDEYYQPLWPLIGGALGYTQRCAGWSFDPSATDETSSLRVVDLTPFAQDPSQHVGQRAAGDWVWWVRTALKGTGDFVLPTSADIGTGCFYNQNQLRLLMTLNTEVPPRRRSGQDNLQLESVSIGLAEAPIRAWADAAMMSEPDYLPLPALGPVASEWSPRAALELFGVSLDSGDLLWFSRKDGQWQAPVNLGAPQTVTLSQTLRPGVLLRRFGEIVVVAVASDGTLWWKRRFDTGVWTAWELVESVTTAVTSGVHLAEQIPGHFHVLARGAAGELRHAEYQDQWLPEWRDLGNQVVGEPAVDLPQEGRLNVFFTNPDGFLQQTYYINGQWSSLKVPYVQGITSSPALGRWSLDQFDLLARSPNGNIARDAYQGTWSFEWNDLGIPMPKGEPVMALRSPGHGDLFVSQADGSVWHVEWPRRPAPSP